MSAILDALGFVGDTLSRPGQAVRGLLAGRPDQLMRLIPGAETMGLVGEGDATSGRDLLQQYGVMDKDDSWGNWGLGLGAEVLTDPLTFAGGFLARKGMQGLGKLAGGRSPGAGASQLLGKRQGFGLGEVAADGSMGFPEFSAVGRPDQKALRAMAALPESAGMEGAYASKLNAGWVPEGQPVLRRHEAMHGLVDQARKTGDSSGLGPVARAAAWIDDGTKTGWRQGAGAMLDETAARMAESRGALGQARNAAGFLFGMSPAERAQYAQLFSQASPAVGRLYSGMGYVPSAAKVGGVGGLGVGGYMGASALQDALGY